MTTDELLKLACRFEFPNGMVVDFRGDDAWVVIYDGACWAQAEKVWRYESQPSSRTDEFIANTRYSLDEAIKMAEQLDAQVRLASKTLRLIRE